MKINDLKKIKKQLGLSNKKLAEISGVPLGTVQKVLGGETKAPRYETLKAMEKALQIELEKSRSMEYSISQGYGTLSAREGGALLEADDDSNGADVHGNYPIDIIEDAKTGQWRRQGMYTVRDFEAVPEGIRVELIDGIIYNMAAPSPVHQVVAQEIFSVLRTYFKSKKNGVRKCIPFMAPVDVQLNDDDKTVVEPDVLIYCNKDKRNISKRLYGAPIFVVEILSPSTQSMDFIKKRSKYMDAGVREYWIVDPINEVIYVDDYDAGTVNIRYSFDDKVPVIVTKGELSVDFSEIRETLEESFGE